MPRAGVRDSAYGPGKDHDFVAVEGSSAQRKPQTAFLPLLYELEPNHRLIHPRCHGANLNTIVPSAMAAALQREVLRSRAKALSISLELTAPVAVPLR